MYVTDTFWAVAQVYSNQEQRAIINLQRQHFRCFYPFFFGTTEKKEVKSVPLFPGYIFVEIDETQPWGHINNTYGIVRLLTTKRKGEVVVDRIPFKFIQPLLRKLVTNPFKEVHIPVGTAVRIQRGSLAEHQAIVTMSKEGRLRLLFQILGREVEVEIEESAVEVV